MRVALTLLILFLCLVPIILLGLALFVIWALRYFLKELQDEELDWERLEEEFKFEEKEET